MFDVAESPLPIQRTLFLQTNKHTNHDYLNSDKWLITSECYYVEQRWITNLPHKSQPYILQNKGVIIRQNIIFIAPYKNRWNMTEVILKRLQWRLLKNWTEFDDNCPKWPSDVAITLDSYVMLMIFCASTRQLFSIGNGFDFLDELILKKFWGKNMTGPTYLNFFRGGVKSERYLLI